VDVFEITREDMVTELGAAGLPSDIRCLITAERFHATWIMTPGVSKMTNYLCLALIMGFISFL
jgi:hypothetical protein